MPIDLVQKLAADASVRSLAERARRARAGGGQGPLVWLMARGSQGSSTPFVSAAVGRVAERPVLLVVGHLDEADDALDELTDAGVSAIRLPALEVLPGESSVSLELFAERVAVVRALRAEGGAPAVVIAPIQALMQPVPGPDVLESLSTTIRRGERRPMAELFRWLDGAGYKRVETVEEPGDYAVRGGIVDVFPPGGGAVEVAGAAGGSGVRQVREGAPFRLDYFGDEVERITEIDLDTMGSDRALESVELTCASLDRAVNVGGAEGSEQRGVAVRAAAKQRGGGGGGRGAQGRRGGDDAGGMEGAIRGVSFLEYLPRETVVVLHETLEVVEQARGYFERVTDGGSGIFGPPAVLAALQKELGAFIEVNQFSAGSAGALGTGEVVDLPVRPLSEMARDPSEAVKQLAADAMTKVHAKRTEGVPGGGAPRTIVLCQNDGELSRFNELVREFAPEAIGDPRLVSQLGYVARGFIWGEEEIEGGLTGGTSVSILPYHELIHRFETRRRRGATRSAGGGGGGASAGDGRLRAGRAMDAFLGFAAGDYVVHRDHGIALFRGLVMMQPREVKRAEEVVLPGERAAKRAEKKKAARDAGHDEYWGQEEYLTLEFAAGARLHVPATKIDQVQRYVGSGGGGAKSGAAGSGASAPPLSPLGGNRWKNQKERVAESVRDLASELLRIRAAREHLPGIRYPADTAWQKEFEAEFPYQETEDQLAAIGEIKKDMLTERPMDRLLCGDVGYGKTELAVRAAFKAVEFGKQVAVLVPTTVLAEQHERTFKSRFADYPFKVESISRFKTTQEINAVLAALRKGQVDVIIGTHRLLSKDVKFADLGLVVIDEEQRFGVEHKERLLALRMTVDVLTLSATPIPRTLHMSMLGLRDISNLSTPPLDRRAVVTEVIPYNARRIQQAIQRELARDGQVYFVHNRVYDILTVADQIQKLVPEARIVVGHGQMPDGELEEVMLKFMRREKGGRGQADILVSTTIIESGIDIPTANTMFIDDADRFGLADLHQLRGRVGRSKHRAYCYMLLDPERTVTEKALKRLKAIEEFSMLGAGFKIAMRDLEIRGAGNILGPEQSGHIAAVGYEMYCQLLDRAVKELRNEPTQVASETSIEIGVTGLIPKPYILSDQRRMEAYRRIATAGGVEEVRKIETELKQAYGEPIPPALDRLLQLAELRVLASALRIRSIAVREKDVLMRAKPEDAVVVGEMLKRVRGASPAGRGGENEAHVTVLPPKSNEESSEVYFRPTPQYMEPGTLLAVLRRRLGG